MDESPASLASRLEALEIENRRLQDDLDEMQILHQTTIEHGEAVEDQLADTNSALAVEKQKSDDLLLNILPAETAEELRRWGQAVPRSYEQVSVLFTDFKGFTQLSEKVTPQQLVAELDLCFRTFDAIISHYPIEKIKTIGDSYLCAGGLPSPNKTHPFDLVSAALEMQSFIHAIQAEKEKRGDPCFLMRVGIHTGPVVAGVVGVKKFAYDIWGDTVNTASRMESSCEVGKVNISGTTYELVKDRFDCTPRGKVAAKNKGDIEMYFVEGPKTFRSRSKSKSAGTRKKSS